MTRQDRALARTILRQYRDRRARHHRRRVAQAVSLRCAVALVEDPMLVFVLITTALLLTAFGAGVAGVLVGAAYYGR